MKHAEARGPAPPLQLTFVLGTRPEVIKLAPLIIEARRRGHAIQVVLSGQHRHLVEPLLRFFQVGVDLDLDVMTPKQTLAGLSTRVLAGLNGHEADIRPHFLIIQGDTTTAFCAAYWAFCRGIPIIHVEAGLRTYDLAAPFPEEGNRQLIGRIACLHLAPTAGAALALAREGVPARCVKIVGNTGIDALLLAVRRLDDEHVLPAVDPDSSPGQHARLLAFIGNHRLVLVTAHRRESFGAGFDDICLGIRQIASEREDVRIVYPVHPNPHVRTVVTERLQGHERILLCEPLPYAGFVDLMRKADVLVTDSGGVQEEGPSLGVPIVVLRDATERPEGVAAGFSTLVGTNPDRIRAGVVAALAHGCQGRGSNPYGDGLASARIIDQLERERGRAGRASNEAGRYPGRRSPAPPPIPAGSQPKRAGHLVAQAGRDAERDVLARPE